MVRLVVLDLLKHFQGGVGVASKHDVRVCVATCVVCIPVGPGGKTSE